MIMWMYRIVRLAQVSALCLVLVACTHNNIPVLPGKIVYSVEIYDGMGMSNISTDIYIMNPDGSDRTPLIFGKGHNNTPAWSPDGGQVIFGSHGLGSSSNLYVVNADGTNMHSLLRDEKGFGSLAWSPNGHEVIYIRGVMGGMQLFSMGDAKPRNFYVENASFCESPSWSIDGSYLAFDCMPEDSIYNHIYISKADGSALKCLTCNTSQADDLKPRWSPDGQYIGFVRKTYDSNGVISTFCVMDTAGQAQRPLFAEDKQFPGNIWDWAWSPDGQWIMLIEDENTSLLCMNVDGKQSYRLKDLPGEPTSLDWSR